MIKTLFDLPRTEASHQIHDHGYWIRHQKHWWRAAWILKAGDRFSVMYVKRMHGTHYHAGYVSTLSEAEALMKKMGRKANQ